jgi:hypothetical protein
MRGAVCAGVLLFALPAAGGGAAQEAKRPPAPRSPRLPDEKSGPALELHFPSLEIGVAEYDEGPTGATGVARAASELAWDAVLSAVAHAPEDGR